MIRNMDSLRRKRQGLQVEGQGSQDDRGAPGSVVKDEKEKSPEIHNAEDAEDFEAEKKTEISSNKDDFAED